MTSIETFAVVADHQTKGRGTRGRNWISGASNLFITISIPVSKITIPWTLVPLRYIHYNLLSIYFGTESLTIE